MALAGVHFHFSILSECQIVTSCNLSNSDSIELHMYKLYILHFSPFPWIETRRRSKAIHTVWDNTCHEVRQPGQVLATGVARLRRNASKRRNTRKAGSWWKLVKHGDESNTPRIVKVRMLQVIAALQVSNSQEYLDKALAICDIVNKSAPRVIQIREECIGDKATFGALSRRPNLIRSPTISEDEGLEPMTDEERRTKEAHLRFEDLWEIRKVADDDEYEDNYFRWLSL
jgi:hypothetical protein